MKNNRILVPILIAFLAVGIIMILTGCSTQKQPIPIPETREGTHVYDNGNLLDDQQEEDINSMCLELRDKTGATFAILTVDGLNGYDTSTYANKVFNAIGIGQKGVDDGILLLVSRPEKTNNVRIEVGRGLEGILNDAKCGRILDNYFVPYRENDQYATAIELTAKAIIIEIANDYDVAIDSTDIPDPVDSEKTEVSLWLVLVVLIVIVIVVIVAVFAEDDGSYSGGSSGGFGGGGFSGGGGGSFGGGGFSGGGGAGR